MSKMKKIKKTRFALPSLVTLGSVFCSFLSMSFVIKAMSMTDGMERMHGFTMAGLAIIGSAVFDLFDGKVARWTHTSTKFGMELDSLADAVSFGVAPAVLIYGFALQYAGVFGLIASFLYISGALLRLARFNIEAPDEGVQTLFKGLPSPAGAAGITAIVLAAIDLKLTSLSQFELNVFAIVTIVLGLMMVSNIRYKTLKGQKTKADIITVIVGLLFFGAMCFVRSLAQAFFLVYCYFIAWGILLSIYMNLRSRPRRRRRKAAKSENAEDAEDADDVEDKPAPAEDKSVSTKDKEPSDEKTAE